MKSSQLKIMLGWLIAIGLGCVVLLVILLVNVASLNKKVATLGSNGPQTTASNDSSQLTALQSSIAGLTNTVNTIETNTTTTVKPSSTLSCSGSTLSFGGSTGSINLTCNPL
jgi:hypothetical protein